jgi:hypothetical protein
MSLIQTPGGIVNRRFLWNLFVLWLCVTVAGILLAHLNAVGAISSLNLRVLLIVLVACVVIAVGYVLKTLKRGSRSYSSADQASASLGVRSETNRPFRPVQLLLGGLVVVMMFSLSYALWGLWEGRHGPLLARLGGILMSFCMILFFTLALARSRR